MNEPVQFRVNVAHGVREQFRVACVKGGVSMSDQVADMISRWLKSDSVGPDVQALSDDAAAPEDDDTEEAQPDDLELLRDEILGWLNNHTAALNKAFQIVATAKQVEASEARAAQLGRQQYDAVLGSIKTISNMITQDVAASNERLFAAIETRRRDWRWLGGAATLGIVATCILLWLIAGAAPGRSLAVRLAGAKTEWKAAALLAGNGSLFQSDLMAETNALLESPDFRDRYARCIERAKTSTRGVRCVLQMTPLVARN